MQKVDSAQRSYMALAPLSSIAAVFINPLASTVMPLLLFFIFRNSRAKVAKVALQTADLAFSVQLWIILASLALMLGISLEWINANEAKQMMTTATSIILILFVVSLIFALYQAINGRSCTHLFSFKIAERIFAAINNRNTNKN